MKEHLQHAKGLRPSLEESDIRGCFGGLPSTVFCADPHLD